jgi:PQQ-dependent catabolism-associated CXXCW motif protein
MTFAKIHCERRRAMGRAFIANIIASALLAFACPAFAEEAAPAEPPGYRLDKFREPVPATLAGATVIDTARAFELWSAKQAVFIDAMARPPKPEGLPREVRWRDAPRSDIPGSIWLPGTGYGELAPETQRYFEQGLARATANDKAKPLVFYCLANCWMSWNAAKRALNLGYASVFWYPDGTDGWGRAEHPLEPRDPEPREQGAGVP